MHALVLALVMSANMATVFGQEPGQPQELIDAERLAAAGDWDQAVETLTRLIQRVESGPRDADSARLLITAYERRALARLQTGDRSNAAIDLTALLQIDPNYAFVAPSPGIRTFFDDTRKAYAGITGAVGSAGGRGRRSREGWVARRRHSTIGNPGAHRSSVVDSRLLSLDGSQAWL